VKLKQIDFERVLGYRPESVIEVEFEERSLEGHPGRIIEGIATIATIDDNMIEVTPEALRGAEGDLLKRSTILENHNFDRPVGKVLESKYDPPTKSLRVRGFVSQTEDTVWTKVKEGVLDKFSVSWRSLEYEEKFDEELQRQKVVVHAMRIFEVSLVSVPALADAAVTGWMERALSASGALLEDVENRAVPYSEPHIVPFRKAPTAPKGRRWDATSEIRKLRRRAGGPGKDKMDWNKYSEGFALVMPDGTSFGDYKFPIRSVSNGRLLASWRALSAATGRLQNANIPAEVKKKLAQRFLREYKEIWKVPDDELPESLKS
jgi:HK97 family phage prohead protease